MKALRHRKSTSLRDGDGSEPWCDCKCPVHSPICSIPACCLNASAQAEKARSCAWLTLGSRVDELQSRVPTFQTQMPGNPWEGNWSLKFSYLKICINSWEQFLCLLPCFLSVSFGRTQVWVWMPGLWSLRNNRHSYPTEIWNCAGAEWYRVLKSCSVKGFFLLLLFFPHNILKVFSLCQLHILILKERPWYLEYTMCLFPSARCTINSLCFQIKWWSRECLQDPQRFQAHNKNVYLFIFRSNHCTPLPAGEWIAGISFNCFPKERVNEVIKPSGWPSVVIY